MEDITSGLNLRKAGGVAMRGIVWYASRSRLLLAVALVLLVLLYCV
jgi:hypothetical protein